MSDFYGGMPGKDFLISETFNNRAELQNAASPKHIPLTTGDYVLIYTTNSEHIDYHNGELWQRIYDPSNPKYKGTYKELIRTNSVFGYGLVGNLAGPQGYTPRIGSNGNWWIGDTDTLKPSRGEVGKDGAKGDPGNMSFKKVSKVPTAEEAAEDTIYLVLDEDKKYFNVYLKECWSLDDVDQ